MSKYKHNRKHDRAHQTALLIASATIPNTFQETLMPRNTVDQGLVTGINMAVNYELANTISKVLEDLAEQLAGTKSSKQNDYQAHVRQRKVSMLVNLLSLGSSYALSKYLSQKPEESVLRGVTRTSADWISKISLASIIVSVLQAITESPNTTSKKRKTINSIPVGLIGGVLTAIYTDHKRRSATKASNGKKLHNNDDVNTLKALGTGLGILGIFGAIDYTRKSFANTITEQLEKLFPDSEDFWWSASHSLAIAGTGLGIYALMHKVYGHIEEVATKIEPGYLMPPSSKFVSGSKHSLVDWKTLSVQGRRYVASALEVDDINTTMEVRNAKEPIRVFIGIDTVEDEKARVKLAIKELERTGAFERSLIMVISPTGTGYVNYVAVESAEYMTKGDMSSVAIQYSKRPSPMSLDRVPEGRWQFKMLVKEIQKKLQEIPQSKRPKFVIFGESLGAWTSQDSFIDQGTDGLVNAGIDKALWIGTPYGSKWKSQVLDKKTRPDVEPVLVGSFDNFGEVDKLDQSTKEKLRYVMITHHNDGVALFGASLLYKKPDWLTDPEKRPPTISKSQYYTSPGTFLLTLLDMKNSMNVIPGQFEASGHDYRADLAEFIAFTYDLNPSKEQLQKIEKALRTNEKDRAQKLNPNA